MRFNDDYVFGALLAALDSEICDYGCDSDDIVEPELLEERDLVSTRKG